MTSIKQIPLKAILTSCCAGMFIVSGTSFPVQSAGGCLSPERPYAPADAQAVREFADIIRRDFDLYFRDLQSFIRCLEEERVWAIEEAHEVTNEYRRIWELLPQSSD